MTSEPDPQSTSNTETGGGTYIGGNVDAGKDFVGRDQHNYNAESITIVHSNVPLITNENDPPAPGESPYRGMEYFDVGDADLFFGREQLTAELVEHLRHNRLLAIVGASGSGKSSLARAGLIPALQGTKPLIDDIQPPKGSGRWAYHIITPTARPLESMAASLTRNSTTVLDTADLIDALRKDARSLHLYARRLVSGDQRLLLLVDQFEELFTLCKDESEQQAFVANLLNAAQPDGIVTLVLTLRADFYHHWARFPELRNALEIQQKYIGSMSYDELRRAIEEPAKAGKWEFQEGLVEQLLNDVGDEPGALPLLSHALLETWKRRSGRRMTLAGYVASGRVQGAIAKSADAIYSDFSEPQQRIARTIFLRLTELGEGSQDTRRRVRPAELILSSSSADEVQSVLKILADARLVTTAENEVQVAHEALIRAWQTLRGWLDDDREGNRIQRRLTEAANQWVEYGKDATLLYRGVLLQQAQEWLTATIDPPNQIEMEFLQESQDAHEKTRRVWRLVVQGLAVLTAVALITASIAWIQTQRVSTSNNQLATTIGRLATTIDQLKTTNYKLDNKNNELDQANKKLDDTVTQLNQTVNELDATNNQLQQTISETQRLANIAFARQLAAQSTSELSKSRYEPAILLALAAGQITDTLEAFSAIRAAIANPGHSRVVFYGHTGNVNQATWSKDERRILTSSADGTARIWDAATGKELGSLEGHTGNVYQATWSKDERRILTSSDDGTARIWDAATGKELIRLEGHKLNVNQATWSQDESKILTSSDDYTVRIWDTATGKELVSLEGHTGSVNQATWNKGESKILTSSDYPDGTARIWNAATGKELVKLEGDMIGVNRATWSQDESKILTSSDDYTVRIWDAATGKELVRLKGHTGPVNQATWNKDESKIFTSSYDGTARIWDAATSKELVRLEGLTGDVYQATWNKDGSKILTSSSRAYKDYTARIWDAATGKELVRLEGHMGHVTQATWSQDESKMLTRSDDHTARIWDATTGKELVKIEGHIGPVYRIAWSKHESKILTSGHDGTARIWDAATGRELLKLEGHMGPVYQVAWSKDESKALTSSNDKTARIWDTTTGKELLRFEGHTDSVYPAIWSKDESKILTASQDGTVRIWDTTTGKELLGLGISPGVFSQVTWSKDESKILTSSDDGTAYVWDATTGKELFRIEGRTGLWQATWNKDESKILTSSYDGTAYIWDATTGKGLLRIKGHTGSVWQAVWSKDESKILTSSEDGTVRIWDAATGKELVRLEGHTGSVYPATWSKDESKILTGSDDHTARIWDAATGKELVRLEGHTGAVAQATWSHDESKILTSSEDGTVRIWYVQMKDLLSAACQWVPRNFTWSEWSQYMADNVSVYRPTCANAPIPPDAIAGIQDEARQQILAGQVLSGTQRLEELNGWLQENGQFDSFGVDVQAFVAEVSATATVTPTKSVP